jgi:xanthine dehydrogenase large subunit
MNPNLHPVTETPLRFWHRDAVVERQNIAACIAKADACLADNVRFENGQVITPTRQRSFSEAVQYA